MTSTRSQIILDVLKAVQAVLDKRLPELNDAQEVTHPAQLAFPFAQNKVTASGDISPASFVKRKPGRKPIANPTPEQLERRLRRQRALARKLQRAAAGHEPTNVHEPAVEERVVELEVELPKPLSFVIPVPVTGDFV